MMIKTNSEGVVLGGIPRVTIVGIGEDDLFNLARDSKRQSDNMTALFVLSALEDFPEMTFTERAALFRKVAQLLEPSLGVLLAKTAELLEIQETHEQREAEMLCSVQNSIREAKRDGNSKALELYLEMEGFLKGTQTDTVMRRKLHADAAQVVADHIVRLLAARPLEPVLHPAITLHRVSLEGVAIHE